RPNEPTGTPTHSAGGGRAGGVPSRNTGPSWPAPSWPAPPSRVKAAVARTTSLPSWLSADSPNAMVRPLRITAVRTVAGPAAPGRREEAAHHDGVGDGHARRGRGDAGGKNEPAVDRAGCPVPPAGQLRREGTRGSGGNDPAVFVEREIPHLRKGEDL